MSASSERGPGRPAGITEARLEKQRWVCAMHAKGIAVETIAAVVECEPAYVRMLINGAKKKDNAPEPAAESEPRQPRRLSRRAAQVRAWEHAEQHVISKLGLAVDAFWVRIVVAIHQEGDGYRLRIGEQGCRFRSREDLADLFGRRAVEINDWLAALVEHGRLIQVDGIDIGIPHGMKLTPAENIRGKKRPAQPPQGGQTVMLHAVRGDLSDATEIPPQTQIKSELNLRSGATEIPQDANKNPISVAPDAAEILARSTESTTTTTTESLSSRRRTLPDAGISVAPDATEIPSGATEINLQRSMSLALLVKEAAGYGSELSERDVAAVGGWIEQGVPDEVVLRAVGEDRAGPDLKPVWGLGLFTKRVMAAWKLEKAARAAKPTTLAATPPVLSPTDQALMDRVQAIKHPNPPLLAAFQTEATATLAYRWLDAGEAWVRFGRRRDLKPPDFALATMARSTFEGDMLAVEEALTEPDTPGAAD